METQGNKLVYIAAGLAVLLLIVIIAWLATGRNKIVSPVPEEGVKVILNTPTPTPSPTLEATASPTLKPKTSPTASPTNKPTTSPTAKPSPTASVSPTASPSP